MGSYDSLVLKCPECRGTLDFQSKAGLCELNVYNTVNVPNKVVVGLHNETECCSLCSKEFTLHVQIIRDIKLVSAESEKNEENEA